MTTKRLFAIVCILVILTNACTTQSDKSSSAYEQPGTVVFADPGLELLYQAAVNGNPQMTYTDQQYRQMFFDWYGGEAAKQVFAEEFAKAQQGTKIAYVQAGTIVTALKANPESWLYALAIYVGVNAIVAMNAETAANLSLPTINIQPKKVIVPNTWNGSSATAVDTVALQNHVRDLIASPIPTQFAHAMTKDGQTEGNAADEVSKATVSWLGTIAAGICNGSINTTHKVFRDNNWKTININTPLNPKESQSPFSCIEWDFHLMIFRWVAEAIENNVPVAEIVFVVKTVYEALFSKLGLSLTPQEMLQMLNLGG